jgi:hypothetical protein
VKINNIIPTEEAFPAGNPVFEFQLPQQFGTRNTREGIVLTEKMKVFRNGTWLRTLATQTPDTINSRGTDALQRPTVTLQ